MFEDWPTERKQDEEIGSDRPPLDILLMARMITRGDRQSSYGHPKNNHGRTAILWNAYFAARNFGGPRWRRQITDEDVCFMNILQKMARDMETPEYDNLVDIAGYAANIEAIRE